MHLPRAVAGHALARLDAPVAGDAFATLAGVHADRPAAAPLPLAAAHAQARSPEAAPRALASPIRARPPARDSQEPA